MVVMVPFVAILRILKLPENGIRRPGRKADMAKHRASQTRGFQTILQRG